MFCRRQAEEMRSRWHNLNRNTPHNKSDGIPTETNAN